MRVNPEGNSAGASKAGNIPVTRPSPPLVASPFSRLAQSYLLIGRFRRETRGTLGAKRAPRRKSALRQAPLVVVVTKLTDDLYLRILWFVGHDARMAHTIEGGRLDHRVVGHIRENETIANLKRMIE